MKKRNNQKLNLTYGFGEKGVAMLVTFFIMGISLAVVLGIGVILMGEIVLVREMGESVKALYVADIGIEQALFLDRKVIPAGAGITRGLCDICTSCTDFDCDPTPGVCGQVGPRCANDDCNDCTITYSSLVVNNNQYRVVTDINEDGTGTIKSYGAHKKITRAIELNFAASAVSPDNHPPLIEWPEVIPISSSSGVDIEIRAEISDARDDIDIVGGYPQARIYDAATNGAIFDQTFTMVKEIPGDPNAITYKYFWQGPEGAYDVDIKACDLAGKCSEALKI
ncbi:MAG: hypothetical protein WC845_00325 [Candidatus Staskawiczbacteria bacterium]|jgi:hypothetical protein